MKWLTTHVASAAASLFLVGAIPPPCQAGNITSVDANVYQIGDVSVTAYSNFDSWTSKVYRDSATESGAGGYSRGQSDSTSSGSTSSSVVGSQTGHVAAGPTGGSLSGSVRAVANASEGAKESLPSGATAQMNSFFQIENTIRFDGPTHIQGVAGFRTTGDSTRIDGLTYNGNGIGGRFEAFGDSLRLDLAISAAARAERGWNFINEFGDLAPSGNHFQASSASAMIVWSTGELPGLSHANPLQPDPTSAEPLPGDVPEPFAGPNWGTLHSFTTPVAEGYGLGDAMLYFDPVLATGYRFLVEGTRFATFLVPDPLPDGDDEFQLVWNDTSYVLAAGQVFDFTAIDPDGARWFDLMGLSVPYDPLAGHAPFVSGFTFTDPGLATVYQAAHVADTSTVPEPGTLALLGLGGIGLLGGAIRKRRKPLVAG